MKRRGDGKKKRKKKEKKKNPFSRSKKRYFSDWREKCSTRYSSCIEGKSRFSRLFVAYDLRGLISTVGNALAHNRCTIQTRDDNSSRDNEKRREREKKGKEENKIIPNITICNQN